MRNKSALHVALVKLSNQVSKVETRCAKSLLPYTIYCAAIHYNVLQISTMGKMSLFLHLDMAHHVSHVILVIIN